MQRAEVAGDEADGHERGEHRRDLERAGGRSPKEERTGHDDPRDRVRSEPGKREGSDAETDADFAAGFFSLDFEPFDFVSVLFAVSEDDFDSDAVDSDFVDESLLAIVASSRLGLLDPDRLSVL